VEIKARNIRWTLEEPPARLGTAEPPGASDPEKAAGMVGGRRRLGEQQARIPELVPQVVGAGRRLVCLANQVCSRHCFEQEEMGSLGWMPAGHEAVDDPSGPLGR